MNKVANNRFLVLLIVISLCFSLNSDNPRWSKDFTNSKKLYTRRFLSKDEIKEILKRKYWLKKQFFYILTVTFALGLFFYFDEYIEINFHNNIFGLPGLFLLSSTVTPKMVDCPDKRVEIITEGDIVRLNIKGVLRIEFEKKSETAKLLVVILSQIKLPPAPNRSNKLSNKVIAKCTGFSAPWISKLINRYEERGIIGLCRQPHGGYLSKKAVKRVETLLRTDISLTPSKISKILVEEEYLKEHNPKAVRNVLKNINLNELLPDIRAQKSGEAESKKLNQLIEKQLTLIQKLLPQVENENSILIDYEEIKEQYQQHKNKSHSNSDYEWDKDQKGVLDEKRKALKQNRLLDLLRFGKTLIRCPECDSLQVEYQNTHKHSYQDIDGNMKTKHSKEYKCEKSLCETNFTIPPADVGLFVRSTRKLQVYAMKMLFKGLSLRKTDLKGIAGYANVSHTTILRWVKKLADTMPKWDEVFDPRCSGKVAIDEKWVKVRKEWHYVFIAIDISSLDILHIDIYPKRDKNSAKTFLSELKAMGYEIESIITDCCPIYEKSIPEIYPEVDHLKCVLHMGRSTRNRLMKIFGSYSNEDYEKLSPKISNIYSSRTKKEFEKSWSDWEKAQKEYSQLKEFSQKLRKQKESILQRILADDIMRTNNHVERVIKEFERKYKGMEKFMSLAYAQAWCKLFQIRFRLTPFERGRNGGKSPAEALGYPVQNLEWTDFILPGKELSKNEIKKIA